MNFNVFDLKKKMFTGQGGTGEALRPMLVITWWVSQSGSFLLLNVELFGLVRFIFFYFSQSAATSI